MIANVAVLLVGAALAAPTPCGNLKSITLPNTTITMAEMVPAGVFTPPPNPAPAAPPAAPAPEAGAAGRGRGGRGGGAAGAQQPPAATPLVVPSFCRVAATLKPTSD